MNMNKRRLFLLLIMPLLFVISSCSNISLTNKEIIKEDTSLHEELFGNDNTISYDLDNSIRQPRRLAEDLVEPPIGVQYLSYKEDTTDYYAVRYVAAIKSLDINARWTRAVSQKNGTQVKALNSDTIVTKAYRTLNNGGVISTCSEEYPGFLYYVVFTMYDIPTSQEDSYVMAYLTISYGEETPVKSKAVITQIKGTGHSFSFDVDSVTNDYFIAINHETGPDTIWYGTAGEDKPNPEENDHAAFTNASMEFISGDTFGLFKLTTTEFVFCDYPTYLGTTATRFTKLYGSSDNYGYFYLTGKYNIYVNYQDKVYVSPTDVITTISFKPNSDWSTGSATFAAYAFSKNDLGETTAHHWYALSSASQGFYTADINIGTYQAIIFCRMSPTMGTVTKNWYFDDINNGYGVWNQTKDLYIDNDATGPTNMRFRRYTLSTTKEGGDSWDDYTGSWGL